MTMSTSLFRPVDQDDIPPDGLVVMSVRRKEEERLMHFRRTFWSMVSVAVIVVVVVVGSEGEGGEMWD